MTNLKLCPCPFCGCEARPVYDEFKRAQKLSNTEADRKFLINLAHLDIPKEDVEAHIHTRLPVYIPKLLEIIIVNRAHAPLVLQIRKHLKENP